MVPKGIDHVDFHPLTVCSNLQARTAPLQNQHAGLPTLVGLFLTTMATLTYQVLLTRIFSVTMWYHFAFIAVSVALFGLTVGALIVHLRPALFRLEHTTERLAQAGALFSIAIVITFATQLIIPFNPEWTFLGVYSSALLYSITSIPFIFSGIAVALALSRYATQVGRLYAADLTGAGLGAIAVIWLLALTEDGPSAVIAIAGVAAAGALAFSFERRHLRIRWATGTLALLLVGLAAGNAYAAQDGDAPLRILWSKGEVESPGLYETWNAFSRIKVSEDPDPANPFAWGLSHTYPGGDPPEELLLQIDASAGTVLTRFDGDTSSLDYLQYDVTNIAHYLRGGADVFVMGSGGGRDILTALTFDQASITAVELNGDILRVANDRFGSFTGHLDKLPNVHITSGEARSHLAASGDEYDIIQISLIDTWAATAAGAFALSENALYTVEAFELFLEHLTEGGILSVSHWYVNDHPASSYRLTALAAAALRAYGVDDPTDHLMFVRSTGGTDFFPSVGTILVTSEPFGPSDVDELHAVADRMAFEVMLSPRSNDPIFVSIATAPDPTSVDIGGPGDMSAPTDDRPFFFQMIRYQDLFDPSLYNHATSEFLTRPVLVLFSLAIAVIGLSLALILLPAALSTTRTALHGLAPMVLFFAAIGLGFIFIEISQMQRLIIFLGHPTFSLSVVLFTLLVFGGIGSFTTHHIIKPALSPALLLPFVALLIVLAAFGLLTPTIIDAFSGSGTRTRILVAGAMLAPMGYFMGMPFPIGMKVAAMRPTSPTAFFWGINGATSVAGSVLTTAVALGWGLAMAFWVGVGSYVFAAIGLALIVRRGRV